MSKSDTKSASNTYPKIGIRPTIDGRYGGVRESLEEQTMEMAKRAAAFLSSELRNSDGSAVQCYVNETCIGGVEEAQRCEENFVREQVGVSLTVTPCWCYGSETMDMSSLPKAIWGFNGTERPGAVYLAAVLAAHSQKGLPAFGIYGKEVQDAGDESIPRDVQEKLLSFAKAGLAVASMKGQVYLSMGGTSMGIAGSIVDHNFFEDYLGMRVESIDLMEFERRIEKEIFDQYEYEMAKAWVKANCKEGHDPNGEAQKRPREALDHEWDTSIKMALITRDLMEGNDKLVEMGYPEESRGHQAILSGFQGQRHWTDARANGDFLEAISNSSFDWNGRRQPRLVATENDALNGVSMLFNYLLTNTAQVFADVRTYWSADAVKRVSGHQLEGRAAEGIIHLINSGSACLDGCGKMRDAKGQPTMKPHWEMNDEDVAQCLGATTWHPSITEYFPGGGWSSKFVSEPNMPITMSRLNLIKGLGPALQIAEGWSVGLPDAVHQTLDDRTNNTWPTTWFVPRCNGKGAFKDVYSVMNNWGANHGAFCSGHVGSQLMTLASMLRIPVYMSNVNEDQLFRPSAWAAFGTKDVESADYRACSSYGPLYKKG